MKRFDSTVANNESAELEFPDWSGMDDSTSRVSPEAAFQFCEQYRRWFPNLRAAWAAQRPEKCPVEFTL